jgi:selenocysteine lyase/cysteine desulfurase
VTAVEIETLGSQRALFEIPDDVTYLNCANMSPQLRRVTEAGLDAVRAKKSPWTLSGPDWFTGTEALRGAFGRLIDADADGIAIVPAASYGVAIAAANVPMDAGQTVVVMDGEFPSNVYAWRELAGRRGGQVTTVRREPGATWADALVETIDERTAVVATSNCHWTDGSYVDLARVGARAREVGAAFVVDASQTAGALPFDVTEIQPDFFVTVGYKWMLGPYGLGFAYIAPRWRDRGVPLEHSWLARRGSEDFSRLVDYTEDYRAGARRFDMGEAPQFVLTPMAAAAVDQLATWSIPRIQSTIATLTDRLAAGATRLGATVLPASERVGHIIGMRFPAALHRRLPAALAAAKVYVSVRGDSIRVAPHLYNDASDVDRFLAVVEECARTA